MQIRDVRTPFLATPSVAAGGRKAAEASAEPQDSLQLMGTWERNKLESVRAEAAALKPSLGEFEPGEVIVKVQDGMGLTEDFAGDYGCAVAEKPDMPRSPFKDFSGEIMRLRLPEA